MVGCEVRVRWWGEVVSLVRGRRGRRVMPKGVKRWGWWCYIMVLGVSLGGLVMGLAGWLSFELHPLEGQRRWALEAKVR